MKWNISELPEAVKTSFSVDEVLRKLGMSKSGGNRETVNRYIAKMNLDKSHFLGQAHRRNSTTPQVKRKELSEILVKNSTYTNTHRLKKRIIQEGLKKHKCEKCGKSKWLEEKIPLELHHLNGNRSDHRIENLSLLCPNCHALSDNYRAKNIKLSVTKEIL